MTDDDFAYNLLWQEVFKQPLPMLGGAKSVRLILARAGVSETRMAEALDMAKNRTDRD